MSSSSYVFHIAPRFSNSIREYKKIDIKKFHSLMNLLIAVTAYLKEIKAESVIMQEVTFINSINTLRTGSFKLFKRPFPRFLTILTLQALN